MAGARAPGELVIHALLQDLDRAQRAAVTHGEGPLLVVAGAGTGKTRVITRRIAWLIATRRARPSEILALTFTDRAANEMQARVDELVPYGYVDTAVHTFHAFGDRLIREFAFELGLPSDPRVLTRAEAVIFLRERLFELGLDRYRPLGDPTRFLAALVGIFSRAKDEDVDAQVFLAHAQKLVESASPDVEHSTAAAPRGSNSAGKRPPDPRAALEEANGHLEVARAYARYQDLLAAAGYVDFGDQVYLALRLLREHPAARERLRRRFRYVLVDEFQDTNRAQLELLAQLVGSRGNLTVVGDDDQAIYAFRGAAVRNILEFRERFGARMVVLRRNHRSRAPILDAARRLIQHNNPARLEVREGIKKQLVAVRRTRRPLPVRHHSFPTAAEEADFVATQVAQRIRAGIPPREVAVLVRANADADPVLRALNLQGVPWRFSGASGLYATPAVRRLLAFLRATANPDSSVDLYALATAEPYRLGGAGLTGLLEIARRSHRSLWAVLEETAEGSPSAIAEEARAAVRRLVADLRAAIELSHQRPAGEVLYDFLRRSGTLTAMAAGGAGVDETILDVARFFEIVRRQSDLLPDPRVPFLAPHLQTLVEAGDDPAAAADDDCDAVSVLTVHKAKGLEFSVVFVAGLADGRFPMRNRREVLSLPDELGAPGGLETDDGLAEERRLCYVALTRARDELVLTSAFDTGGRRLRHRSPFVAEALDISPEAVATPSPPVADLVALGRYAPADAVASAARASPTSAVFSFTQLDDYLSCPARYRYRHLLRLPTLPHHALTYGIALHEAVAAFGRSQIQGHALSEAGVLEVFARAWSGLGFLSREHEEARAAAGRAALVRFREAALQSDRRPVLVEEPFEVSLDGIRLQGRFDRIDDGPQGVVITDFKSTDVRDTRRAKERARESLQLALYALAWQAREGALPAATELVFLDSGLVGSVHPEPTRLAAASRRMREAAEGIRAGAFAARPDAVACRFCAFREICASSAA
ncbi:MAG: ATP-dependent helicase [Candidatus Limnocylindrales bacterium]